MGWKAGYQQLCASRNALILLFGLLLLVINILYWLHQNPVLGHDQYGLMFEARRLLSGTRLYSPRLAEPNPPFIIWFSVIPVLAAELFHVTETTAFQFVIFAMLVVSALWSIRIAQKYERLRDFRALLLLAAFIVVVESPLRVLLYGQRENLLVICILPYILAIAFDVMHTLPVSERIALGVCAGLGVCFKPHHALVIAAIEIALLLLHRSLRHLRSVEFLSATLTCVLYVGAIALFTPQYLTPNLALLRETYWALGSHSIPYLALHQVPEMGSILLIGVVALLYFKNSSDRPAIACLLSAGLAASVAYDIQHTDWGYHRYPVIAFIALAAGVLAVLAVRAFLARHDAAPSRLLIAGLALAMGAFVFFQQRTQPNTELPNDGGAFAGLSQGDTVYIFSTGAEMFPVAYRRGLEWGSRFPCLWLLPSIVANSPGGRDLAPKDTPFKALTPEQVAVLSRMQRKETAEDLDSWKPSVVLVQKCPCDFIYNGRFDMLEWFSKDQDFRNSWSRYEKQRSIPGFDIYRRYPQRASE